MNTNLPNEFDELAGGDVTQYVRANVTTLSFPEKLMYMMISVEKETARNTRAQPPAIVWNADGTILVVLNSKELEDVWIPQFFGSKCKFKSFTRKLYRWGFKKVRLGAGANADAAKKSSSQMFAELNIAQKHQGCFQHRYFQRDNKNLLYRMENTTHDKTQRMNDVRRSQQQWLACNRQVAHERLPTIPADQSMASTNQADFATIANIGQQRDQELTNVLTTLPQQQHGLAQLLAQHSHTGSSNAWQIVPQPFTQLPASPPMSDDQQRRSPQNT